METFFFKKQFTSKFWLQVCFTQVSRRLPAAQVWKYSINQMTPHCFAPSDPHLSNYSVMSSSEEDEVVSELIPNP